MSTVRQPSCQVTVAGSPLTDVVSVRVTHSLRQRYATAEVTTYVEPAWLSAYWEPCVITMGSSVATAGTVFVGYRTPVSYNLSDHTVVQSFAGPLIVAERTICRTPDGSALASAAGTTTAGYVAAALTAAGLTASMGTIAGGTAICGAVASKEWRWSEGETALQYVERIDSVDCGYRTYETLPSVAGGTAVIRRTLVTPEPAGTPVYTLQEAINIKEGRSTHSPLPIKNYVTCKGYDRGTGAVSWTVQQAHPYATDAAGSPAYYPLAHQSSLIERAGTADAGGGLACEAVARWLLDLNNREELVTSITTPEFYPLSPGDTVGVVAPDRMGTSEGHWVQSVTRSWDAGGGLSMSLECTSGIESGSAVVTVTR